MSFLFPEIEPSVGELCTGFVRESAYILDEHKEEDPFEIGVSPVNNSDIRDPNL
jgi:hypothetical protein